MFTTVSARLDAQLKEDAEEVLSALGLTHSTAISALYSQIVMQQGLPFDLRLPKAQRQQPSVEETAAAVRRVAESFGVARAWLFGESARSGGEAGQIEMRIEEDPDGSVDVSGLVQSLSRQLATPVSVLKTSDLSRKFVRSIQAEEVLVYEKGNPLLG